jgi:ABC-2 type transport system ATP-binding protein
MRQRLCLAAALLGDPPVLVLDEPVNGLDTDGIRWIRGLLKALAAEGRTILLSSHLMTEMQQTADHLIVIGAGRLLADSGIDAFITHHSAARTRVRTPHLDRLQPALEAAGAHIVTLRDGAVVVEDLTTVDIGTTAARLGVTLHELSPQPESLEDVYTRMTAATVEFPGTVTA